MHTSRRHFKANAWVLGNPETLVMLSGAFFFGWILVIPFEGQILYGFMEKTAIENQQLNMMATGAHLLGLLASGLLVKTLRQAWSVMITATLFCVALNLTLLMPGTSWLTTAFLLMAFVSATFVAAWGVCLKEQVAPQRRYKTVVDVLILSNLLMMCIDVMVLNWQMTPAKFVALAYAAVAALLMFRLKPASQEVQEKLRQTGAAEESAQSPAAMNRAFMWLCLFILLITLNSGLMYQVVGPAYAQLSQLASFYWAVPYMAALAVLRNLPQQANRASTLYVALAFMGLGYVLFQLLPVSAAAYVAVNTFLMGALGVFDLFWWSLMISFIGITKRPALILGLGLGTNVLGILVGGLAGEGMQAAQRVSGGVSLAAFSVIFVGLALLPLVNRELSKVFRHHVFLVNPTPLAGAPFTEGNAFHGEGQQVKTQKTGPIRSQTLVEETEKRLEKEPNMEDFQEAYQLTDREMDLVRHLQKGYTYRAMAAALDISENTVKYHTKNLYQKTHVKNKMELLKIIDGYHHIPSPNETSLPTEDEYS